MTNIGEMIEFAGNQEPRCPCVLILDTSGSMQGPPIDALNEGLKTFRNELMNDNLARKRVEVAIVEFNTTVRVVQDFVTAETFQPPVLTARGQTEMVKGIQTSLDLIYNRKAKYKSSGIQYYQPWAFLITDGYATGYEEIADRIRQDESDRRVTFFAVGVKGADMNCLRCLSVRPPALLDGINFRGLFRWLSASLRQVSRAKPGQMEPLGERTWEVYTG